MKAKFYTQSALLFSLVCLPAIAASVQYDQLIVFGDSLSDTGNATIGSGGLYPGPNYAPGRFTDGAGTTPATTGPFGLWVDQLSARLGVADPQPFLAGGTDFAVASAKTGSNGLDGISDQLKYFAAANPGGAPSQSLYAIWGGANDLYFGGNTAVTAADSLASNIQTLAAGGAKSFLWLNLPALGSTPLGVAGGQGAALNTAVTAFNSEWSMDLAKLQAAGVNVIGVDVNSLFVKVAANPGNYGFSNVTAPAQGMAGVNPNSYLFWDQEHPTTAGHALVADLAYNDLTPTPEPGSLLLIMAGLGGLGMAARRRAVR